jgi:hypothetical protein
MSMADTKNKGTDKAPETALGPAAKPARDGDPSLPALPDETTVEEKKGDKA